MSGHTPGPWHWAEYYADNGGKYQNLERSCAQVVIDGEYGCSVSDEDRSLIAAAPDLLDALKELADEAFRNMSGGAGHLIDNAYAAIAKAEGHDS